MSTGKIFYETAEIVILVHKFRDPMLTIESDDYEFLYSELGKKHAGMQCNFHADTEEYKQLNNLLNKLGDVVREIDDFCNKHKNTQDGQ